MSITTEKMLCLLIYFLFMAQIWLAVRYLFGGRFIRRWIWTVVIVLVAFFGILDFVTTSGYDHLNSVLLLVSYFATVKKPFGENWSWSIRKYVFLKCQWLVIFQIIMLVTYPWNLMQIGKERFCVITDCVCTLWILLLCIVYQFSVRTGLLKKAEKIIRRLLVPFLVLLFFEMIFASALYYKTQMDYGSGFHKKLAYVLSIVFVISYSLYALIVFYIRKINVEVERMLELEKLNTERKTLYYEALLKKEEETRKYRHDMDAHIMFLTNMAEENDLEGIRSYLSQMMEHSREIKESVFTTGIRALDGILNYYILNLKEGIRISVHGRCDSPLEITDMDFCTVFSNLIRNMAEAVNSYMLPDAFFDIQITEGVLYVEFILENSADEKEFHFDKKGNFLTSKKDKRNHGFGIESAKSVVEKNGGKFEAVVKKGKFRCRVILRKPKKE